ncbi:glutathione S-transferase [Rhexocercosporidium sp. MPI-PUGE-AT-0058]|nr:glutathione S-transferase [Rhexocercosporidium sp. MPI-PUGE-AT-0058]
MTTPKSPKGASLTIYVDCVSPYSWFGISSLFKHRPGLLAHGVTVDIQPFFLGGARDAAGNPWQPTPKWKEAFSKQDSTMTGELLGLKVVQPKEFPIMSLFPVRVATYIKNHYPSAKFDATFLALVSGYWSHGINISQPSGIIQALSSIFPEAEIEEIMKKALEPENKKKVIETTKESGAFGAPWIVGIDSKGEKKSWFGNDRWDQVFAHLGVPYEPVHVVMPKESKL